MQVAKRSEEVWYYYTWAKSGPLPVSVGKALLKPSYVHSFTYCLGLLSHYSNRTEQAPQRPGGPQN